MGTRGIVQGQRVASLSTARLFTFFNSPNQLTIGKRREKSNVMGSDLEVLKHVLICGAVILG